jgi:hypothetical protein
MMPVASSNAANGTPNRKAAHRYQAVPARRHPAIQHGYAHIPHSAQTPDERPAHCLGARAATSGRPRLTASVSSPEPTYQPPAMFFGDLNVLEPGHQPHYPFFAPFECDFYRQLTDEHGLVDAFRALHPDTVEYSWVGRTGDGYRYDHAHCTADLAGTLLACDYVHQPRLDRLSDHSALSVRLAVDSGEQLITSGPAAASAPSTLF